MASGLFALLDDIAVLARAAIASLDDMTAAALKASAKSAGVIIDDAAVTPQYVRGVSPKRELNVIWRIARGSLANKFLIILPLALILTAWAPWLLPILLIIGGSYLVYEGAEKVLSWFGVQLHHDETEAVHTSDSLEFENKLVGGAVRTDLILSAEIMLISLSYIETKIFWEQLGILVIIALLMTLLVYGTVAILVRVDDLGLLLSESPSKFWQKLGTRLVLMMPTVFNVMAVIGAVAMLWVGGHLFIKSLADLGFTFLYDIAHWISESLSFLGSFAAWVGDTVYSAIFGLVLGMIILGAFVLVRSLFKNKNEKHIA